MKRLFLFIFIFVLCFGQLSAQKQSKAKNKVKFVVAEKTPQQKLYEELLPATAKVLFIDSIVVDKADFLNKINLPDNLGKLVEDNKKVCYTNEFANTTIYAEGDTVSGRHLYIAHKYGNKWEEPQIITELQNKFPDYPFLMTDGVTLYFSAEGEGSVGGKDIFRTIFNTDESHFYEATNMGLPYNSPANEYMMAISDYDNIGWLVSDRYQPEGKVCVYLFEPSAQRKTFAEDTDEETLNKFAKLESIKSTWQFGNREAALTRFTTLQNRENAKDDNTKMASQDNPSDNQNNTNSNPVENPGDTGKGTNPEPPSIFTVEQLPMFQACKGLSRAEQKACFDEQLAKAIVKHLVYPEDDLEEGKQGVAQVEFIIDENGAITNVVALNNKRATSDMQKAAEKAVKRIPKLIPAKQGDKPVRIKYSIPVVFKIR